MRICENGVYRDMTADEVAAFEASLQKIPDMPDENRQLTERIEMLEECLLEMSMTVYA